MMPEHAALFENGPRMRPGSNMQMTGRDGVYTFSARPVPAVDEVAQVDYSFAGAWKPTLNGSDVDLTAGSIFDGSTTWTPTVTGIALVAASFNYIYLHCELNPTTEDGFVTGGGLSSATVEAHSSVQTNSNTDAYILLCTIDLTNNNEVTRYQWFSFGCQLRNSGVGDVVFNYW